MENSNEGNGQLAMKTILSLRMVLPRHWLMAQGH